MNRLVFSTSPSIELATNTFIDCPTILQFDDTPLIQVVRTEQAGFSTEIPIFHEDGKYLAKVVGSQIYTTAEGEKANIKLSHEKDLTACSLDGQTLFELRRIGAAALNASAELHTNNGYFVKYFGDTPSLLGTDGKSISIGGLIMTNCTFSGCRIGVWLKSDGSVSVGCS